MKPFLCTLMVLLFFSSPLNAEPNATFKEKAATQGLMVELRSGGFVLYMRHGETDSSRPDRVPHVDLNDCSTQRQLTKEGRETAAFVGRAVRRAGIPVREVVSSPFCRAKESARAAFGERFQVVNQLAYTANMTSEEKKPNLESTRRYLSETVAGGGNRVIVAHAPNLADIMGYFPKPGTVVVFRPLGPRGFEYVASIHPDSWNRLLK